MAALRWLLAVGRSLPDDDDVRRSPVLEEAEGRRWLDRSLPLVAEDMARAATVKRANAKTNGAAERRNPKEKRGKLTMKGECVC